MKIIRLITLLGLISTLSVAGTKEINIKNIKLSFSDQKGKVDTAVKVIYANGKTAYLVPLDAKKKKFTEIEYSKVLENGLEVIYASKLNGAVSYTYTVNEDTGYIKMQASSFDCYLQLQLEAEALVIPDHVTNDELFWLTENSKPIRIPGDNHLFVELLDNGSAMLNCLWNSPEQTIIATSKSVIFSCAPDNKIWLGFLVKNDIWYKTKTKLNEEYTAVDWVPPFDAEWHMLIKRKQGHLILENNTTDMWLLYDNDKEHKHINKGIYLTSPAEHIAWSSGIGRIGYPCFFENGKSYLRLPKYNETKYKNVSYSGAQAIYPFSTQDDGNLDILLPIDAVSEILGKNSMENLYMSFSTRPSFRATCGVTEEIEKYFYRGTEEVEKKKEYIKNIIERMDIFVHIVNTQLKENARFVASLQAWLKTKQKQYPELSDTINNYIKDLDQVNRYYLIKKEDIKTPAYYMTLSKKLNDVIDDNTIDEEERENLVKDLGRKIRHMNGNQDTTAGLQRIYLKALNQHLTLTLTQTDDPDKIELLTQFRKSLHQKLKVRGMMEGK